MAERPERARCAFEFAPGVRCEMVAGHDDPYYPYMDFGQAGWYSTELSPGTDHVVHARPRAVPPTEEWTGNERRGAVEQWPVFRRAALLP